MSQAASEANSAMDETKNNGEVSDDNGIIGDEEGTTQPDTEATVTASDVNE